MRYNNTKQKQTKKTWKLNRSITSNATTHAKVPVAKATIYEQSDRAPYIPTFVTVYQWIGHALKHLKIGEI